MKKWLSLFVVLVLSVYGNAELDACRMEIEKINQQIQKLDAEKQKHVELAKKYQMEGDRWQYNTGRIDDAHADWYKADDERAKAIELQHQIDLLSEKKERIYQIYPELQHVHD